MAKSRVVNGCLQGDYSTNVDERQPKIKLINITKTVDSFLIDCIISQLKYERMTL
jgi:hypothetical protein